MNPSKNIHELLNDYSTEIRQQHSNNEFVPRQMDTKENKNIEDHFATLVADVKKSGDLNKAIALLDLSSGMLTKPETNSTVPLFMALLFGILVSRVSFQPFKNRIINFAPYPLFLEVEGQTLLESVRKSYGSHWGRCLDLMAVFLLILKTSNSIGVQKDDFPDTLFILFNTNNKDIFMELEEYHHQLNFESVKIEYAKWNMSEEASNPISLKDHEVIFLSGCSEENLKICIENKCTKKDIKL